jgi:glycosyltransferase involved in cell wall biosynthesis
MRLERPKPCEGKPRVSVVIPCYKYGSYLAGAVRSAIDEQPGVDVDVCIVDDASPDDSGAIADRIAEADPRVRVLHHEVNRGHLRTYNDGIAAVSGKYVVLLSADDLLAPGSLARSTALMEAHPTVGLTYGFVNVFNDQAPAVPTRVRNWSYWNGRDWAKWVCRRGGNAIFNPEVVMRRDLLNEIGAYDLALPHTADMYLWLRAAQVGDIGRVNGPVQAFYRMHGDNMHLTDFAGVITDVRQRAMTIEKLFGAAAPGADRELYTVARRAIARESLDLAASAYDRGERDQVPVDEFKAVAQELWPQVSRSLRWKLLLRREHVATPTSWMRATDLGRSVMHKARWRRWRRYGV